MFGKKSWDSVGGPLQAHRTRVKKRGRSKVLNASSREKPLTNERGHRCK